MRLLGIGIGSALIAGAFAFATPVWAHDGHHHGWHKHRHGAHGQHHRHHRHHGHRHVPRHYTYYYPPYPAYAYAPPPPPPGVHIVVPNIYIPLR